MSYAMIDIYCESYPRPPREVTLDIVGTCDVVHGAQQLSLFNTHHGERGFLPIHVYDTPSGRQVRGHIRRTAHRIRMHCRTRS